MVCVCMYVCVCVCVCQYCHSLTVCVTQLCMRHCVRIIGVWWSMGGVCVVCVSLCICSFFFFFCSLFQEWLCAESFGNENFGSKFFLNIDIELDGKKLYTQLVYAFSSPFSSMK